MRVATDMSDCQKASLRAKHATKTEDERRKRSRNSSYANPNFIPEQVFPTSKCNWQGMQKLCLQLGEAAREGTVRQWRGGRV